MPGGNNQEQNNIQINGNGFLMTNSLQLMNQVRGDVTRKPGMGVQPSAIEGAPTELELFLDLKKAGHNPDRSNTITSGFYFYLMGVKGMSFEQAIQVVPPNQNDYVNHVKDYWKFIKDNPIRDVKDNVDTVDLPIETRRKSLRNWADLCSNCAKKFAEYRLPDIDYSDPVQVGQHAHEIVFLSGILQDFTQEMEMFTEFYRADAKLVCNEYDRLYNDSAYFTNLQGITDLIKKAHFPLDNGTSAQSKRIAASSRVLLKDYSPIIRGKTVGEIKDSHLINVTDSQAVSQSCVAFLMSDNPDVQTRLGVQGATQILQGGRNQAFEDEIRSQNRFYKADTRIKISNKYLEMGTCTFRDYLNSESKKEAIKTAVAQLFAGNPTNEELIQKIQFDRQGKLGNTINDAFHPFDLEGFPAFREQAGVQLMDMFYIDGKTPAELWGEKYSSVKDNPVLFQILLQAEVLNTFYQTDKEIEIDTPQLTMDNRYITVRQPIARSPLTIRRGYDLLDRINELHTQFENEYRELKSAENRLTEEEKGLLAPAEEYHKMREALKRCVNTSKPDGSFDKFCFALREYHTACREFEAKLKSLPNQGMGLDEGRSPEYAKVRQHINSLAAENIKKVSEIEQEIRNETKRQGLMHHDDDQMIEPGKLYYAGEHRKFSHFKTQLDKEVGMRSYNPDDFTPESRKRFYHEEDYDWMAKHNDIDPDTGVNIIVDPWDKNVGQKHQFLLDDLSLDLGDKQLVHFVRLGGQMNPVVNTVRKNGKETRYNDKGVWFESIGSSQTREDTNMSVFCLWLMGEKGYSIEDIAKMTGIPVMGADGKIKNQDMINRLPGLQNEFLKFIEDHPLYDAKRGVGEAYEKRIECRKTEREYAEDVKAWTNVFSKATDKMKEYRIPDIDYSNTNHVRSKSAELTLLRELSINFGQELPKIFGGKHPVKPTAEFAYEQMGGEEKYHKMMQDWIAFQSLVCPLSMGYFFQTTFNEGLDLGMYSSRTVRMTGNRMAADIELAPYKGKTFGEAIGDYKAKSIGGMDISSKLLSSPNESGMNVFDPKPYFGYLSGRERREFENTVGKTYREGRSQYAADTETRIHDTCAGIMNFRFEDGANGNHKWLKEALRNTGDDPQAMLDLLKECCDKKITEDQVESRAEYGSVRCFLRAQMMDLIGSDYKGILGVAEKKLTDLFLIDGQTPEERWGAKYADLSDSDKDACFLAEITRTILTADAKIEMRDYRFGEKGELTEVKPRVVAEKAETLNKFAQYAEQYEFATSELKRELLAIQKEFLATQENQNSNRYHEPGEEGNELREGSELYQNMTVALDRCIKDLDENSTTTQHTLEKHLAQLRAAGETYYEARYGRFFRPIRDKGTKRLAASDKTKKMTASFIDRLATIRGNLDSEMYAFETAEFEMDKTRLEPLYNAPLKDLKKFKQRVQKRTGLADSSREEIETRYGKDHMEEFIHKVHREPRPEGAKADNPLNMAFVYLQMTASKLYNEDNVTARDIRRMDRFQDEVQKLAKNPLFQRCSHAGIENCVRDWNEIENRAEVKREALEADMINMLKRNGSFARYLVKPEGELQPKDRYRVDELNQFREDAAKKLEKSVKKAGDLYVKPKERREAYRKIAKVAVMQLLLDASPTAERTLQSIAADELAHSRNDALKGDKTMKQLTNSAYKFFEGKKILEQGNIKEVLEKLDSGSLKNDLKKHLETQFKTELERANAEKKPGIQMADPPQAQGGNNGPGLGMG